MVAAKLIDCSNERLNRWWCELFVDFEGAGEEVDEAKERKMRTRRGDGDYILSTYETRSAAISYFENLHFLCAFAIVKIVLLNWKTIPKLSEGLDFENCEVIERTICLATGPKRAELHIPT